MTQALSGEELVQRIEDVLPQAVPEFTTDGVLVRKEALPEVMRFLKETPGLDFDYLVSITGVDYRDYLEVVYHLVSLQHNHSLVVKTRCDRESPVIPSVVSLWRGADFQEREIYDLLGIKFEGHPDLRRLLLWEGFPGHPLRKDWSPPEEAPTSSEENN